MGGEVCYQRTRERGPWYEIQSIKNIIVFKESQGEDASLERSLLKSWGQYKGWELEMPHRKRTKSKSRRSNQMVKGNLSVEEK